MILESQILVCRIPALLMILYKYNINWSEGIFFKEVVEFYDIWQKWKCLISVLKIINKCRTTFSLSCKVFMALILCSFCSVLSGYFKSHSVDRMKKFKRRLSLTLRGSQTIDESLSELAEQMTIEENSSKDNGKYLGGREECFTLLIYK